MFVKEMDCVFFAFCDNCKIKSICGFMTIKQTCEILNEKGWDCDETKESSNCPSCSRR